MVSLSFTLKCIYVYLWENAHQTWAHKNGMYNIITIHIMSKMRGEKWQRE